MKHENYTIQSLLKGYKDKEFSPREIFDHYAGKIKKENEELNAYLSTFQFAEQSSSPEGDLGGVPSAIKDNILIDGTVATGGSKILKNYVSAYDATVIRKLKEAGALFLGKTNL